MAKTHRNSLPPGHKLLWYEINKILGQGGFGITYLAHDMNLDRDVAIKEYLPVEIAVRDGDATVHPLSDEHAEQYEWGLKRFISEARTLSKFRHPSIVRVDSVFEENNSGYMVMQYEDGISLQDKLAGRKTLDAEALQKIVPPLLDGLEQIHSLGFIHRDIKPDNIYLRNDGSPVLLDFGSARQALGEQTKTLTSMVSPGYVPFEQYYSKSDEQGAFTDIYGLGATLYRATTGRAPLDAIERSKSAIRGSLDTCVPAYELARDKCPDHFLRAIDHAIQFKSEERPQTIEEWRKDFDGTTEWPLSEEVPEDNATFINITEAEISISPDPDGIDVNKRVEQSPAKPDNERGAKVSSPTLNEKVSAATPDTDIQPVSHLLRNVFLILLMALFVGAYFGWQWYEKDKPVQIEKKILERTERTEQERLVVEEKREAERAEQERLVVEEKREAERAELERLAVEQERESERAEQERQAEAQRAAAVERKRNEEDKAKKSLSMSSNVYDKLTKARELIAAKQYDRGLAALKALAKEKILSSYEKAQIYYSLGFSQFVVNDYGEALRSYENVLKQAELPESLMTNALYYMAQIYYDMTEYRESLTSLKKAYNSIRENGENPSENMLKLMSANYQKLGDNNNLLNIFRRMLALYPKTEYWLAIAETYSNLGQHDEQISIMERLYESDELSTASQQINLASLHVLHGEPIRAVEILERGLAEGLIQRSNSNLLLLSWAQAMLQGNP